MKHVLIVLKRLMAMLVDMVIIAAYALLLYLFVTPILREEV